MVEYKWVILQVGRSGECITDIGIFYSNKQEANFQQPDSKPKCPSYHHEAGRCHKHGRSERTCYLTDLVGQVLVHQYPMFSIYFVCLVEKSFFKKIRFSVFDFLRRPLWSGSSKLRTANTYNEKCKEAETLHNNVMLSALLTASNECKEIYAILVVYIIAIKSIKKVCCISIG